MNNEILAQQKAHALNNEIEVPDLIRTPIIDDHVTPLETKFVIPNKK